MENMQNDKDLIANTLDSNQKGDLYVEACKNYQSAQALSKDPVKTFTYKLEI